MTTGLKNVPVVVVLFWQDFTYAATALKLLCGYDVTPFMLQTFPEGYFNSYRDEKTRKTNVISLMKKAIKLREEWESLRILLDVVRQREKRKLALLKLEQEVFVSLPSQFCTLPMFFADCRRRGLRRLANRTKSPYQCSCQVESQTHQIRG